MQIACPQCAMQYILDERLLPPGGAPVQCTRCSHVFTAVPGGAQRPSTKAFGVETVPAQDAPPRGRPGSSASGDKVEPRSPRTSTQVFSGGAASLRSTQVFGAGTGSGEAPADLAGRASTPVFGRAPPAPRASTQVFGSAPATPPPPAPRASTQVFGSAPASRGAEPPPRTPTEGFGAPAAEAPLRAPTPGLSSPARAGTQVFGGAAAEPPVAAPRASTQVFGAPVAPPSMPAARPGRVDLPPELLAERGARPGAARAPPARRRPRRWLLLLLVALLALLAFFAWRTVQRRGSAFPLAAVAARDSAATLLRRDDARSRQQAIGELERVLQAHPGYLEARAELVVALALELDDVKVEQALRRQEGLAAQREREALDGKRAPQDADDVAAQLPTVERANREVVERLDRRAAQLSARAEAALRQLEPEADGVATPAEQRARVRAQAVLGAVQGAPGSMARAEQLRDDGGGLGWDVIAEAEYVLNAPSSSLGPTARNDSVRALEALRQRDAAFLRAYVLGARLALAAGERRTAAALLEMAVALNPGHEVARALQEVARAEGGARDTAP